MGNEYDFCLKDELGGQPVKWDELIKIMEEATLKELEKSNKI